MSKRAAAIALLGILLNLPVAGQPLESEDPLALSSEMVAYLDQHLSQHRDPLETLRELLSLVFNNHELGFQYEISTHTAAETFRLRRGNCLSFTNMFIAMARHLGLEARFREAETVPVWGQRGQVFTVSQHINVAVDMGSRWFLVDLYPEIGELEIGGRIVSDDRGLAHYYNNLAVERLAEGDLSGALDFLELALELAPDAPFLWTNLGVIRSHRKDHRGAEKAYLRALVLQKNHLPAVSNLASTYALMGKLKLAQRYRDKARRFREQNPYYHYHLGLQAWTSGDLQKAAKHYKKAIRLKKEEHRFHFGLAQVLTRLGKTKQALHHLEKAELYAPDESGRYRYHQKQRLLLARR